MGVANPLRLLRLLVAQVDAQVEAVVIPLGVVIAAPLTVRLHSVDIAVHLAAFVAKAARITIDLSAVGL